MNTLITETEPKVRQSEPNGVLLRLWEDAERVIAEENEAKAAREQAKEETAARKSESSEMSPTRVRYAYD